MRNHFPSMASYFNFRAGKLIFHFRIIALLSFLLTMVPVVAIAHTADDAGTGFLSGLLHPIYGPDHFLAMLCVGIVSAQLGGRNIWIVPSLFVLAMIGGGILGIYQMGLPLVEFGIALSVIVLGIAIVMAQRESGRLLIMLFVIFFGIFHGYAHGYEMPNSASPIYYAFGFVVSTSCIHLLGVLIGYVFTTRKELNHYLRYAGVAIAGIGSLFVFNILMA